MDSPYEICFYPIPCDNVRGTRWQRAPRHMKENTTRILLWIVKHEAEQLQSTEK